MKYNIVAVINLFLGLLQIIYPIVTFLFIIPQVVTLYDQLSIKPNFLPAYAVLIAIFIMGIANGFLAFKLFSKSPDAKNAYFKYSIIVIIITGVLTVIFFAIAQVTIISAIYNIIKEF